MPAAAAAPAATELAITTYANGFGRWFAYVVVSPPLSDSGLSSDAPTAQWQRVREAAREAVITELVLRERKTTETEAQARARMDEALPALQLIATENDGEGSTSSATFGEPH